MQNKVCLITNTNAQEFEHDINLCLEAIGQLNLLDIKYTTGYMKESDSLYYSALIIYREDSLE